MTDKILNSKVRVKDIIENKLLFPGFLSELQKKEIEKIVEKSDWIKCLDKMPNNCFKVQFRNIEQNSIIRLPFRRIVGNAIEWDNGDASFQSFTYISNLEWFNDE